MNSCYTSHFLHIFAETSEFLWNPAILEACRPESGRKATRKTASLVSNPGYCALFCSIHFLSFAESPCITSHHVTRHYNITITFGFFLTKGWSNTGRLYMEGDNRICKCKARGPFGSPLTRVHKSVWSIQCANQPSKHCVLTRYCILE